MKIKHCQTEPLVSTDACEVWVCSDCGTLHIHTGPISLRFKTDHFEALAATLHEAVHKLRHRQAGTGSSAEPLDAQLSH